MVDVYQGAFGAEQAERLLWRAGFGPRPGEAEALAGEGLDGAVELARLTRAASSSSGRSPTDDKGHPLAPYDAWGHDHCWWLDRMVRTSRPLVERMTLVWHDWFATSNDGVGSQRLMLDQNELFRSTGSATSTAAARPSRAIRRCSLWLNGTENRKDAPNENYAREMMELFTLGADRQAYTEGDVREQARSLTGWENRWSKRRGTTTSTSTPAATTPARRWSSARRGDFAGGTRARRASHHPPHPSFFVTKLWSYFVPTPPDAPTLAGLEAAVLAAAARCSRSSRRSSSTRRCTRGSGW